MKKSSIILVACMAMISCSNSYKVKTVELTNKVDSLSFAFGYSNGDYLASSMFSEGVTEEDVAEFVEALDRGYNESDDAQAPRYESLGHDIGCYFASMGEGGLNGVPRWRVDEKLLFQGLINGVYEDTLMMNRLDAEKYVMGKLKETHPEEGQALKPITGKCPTSVKPVKLKSEIDSLNYIVGFINGFDISKVVFESADVDKDKVIKTFAAKVNEGAAHPLKHFRESMMYRGYGYQLRQVKDNQNFLGLKDHDFNYEMLRQGFVNGMFKDSLQIDAATANSIVNEEVSAVREAEARRQAEEIKLKDADRIAREEAFLAENAKKKGVIVTESGLQYQILRQGNGAKPVATDKVRVHYHGTLLDGTVFDSSVERKQPAEFGVTQVIPGWVEVLQLMPVGSKYKVFLPYQLAYNDRQAGKIPPFSMLIFEIELLDIVK